ncbi:hypothetical protein [Anaerofustis butyriciformans]|uniref:hypothetical protein n=1 Tax=Anaerofustis butyriciformans TaxID=3108533 RepID=UPI002E34F11F|nr:hypothetical protein [Anaerofustis sp. HA2171]
MKRLPRKIIREEKNYFRNDYDSIEDELKIDLDDLVIKDDKYYEEKYNESVNELKENIKNKKHINSTDFYNLGNNEEVKEIKEEQQKEQISISNPINNEIYVKTSKDEKPKEQININDSIRGEIYVKDLLKDKENKEDTKNKNQSVQEDNENKSKSEKKDKEDKNQTVQENKNEIKIKKEDNKITVKKDNSQTNNKSKKKAKIIASIIACSLISIILFLFFTKEISIKTKNGIFSINNTNLISSIDEQNSINYSFSSDYLYTYFDEEKVYYLNPTKETINNESDYTKEVSDTKNPVYFKTNVYSSNKIEEIIIEYDMSNLSNEEIQKNDIVFCAYVNLVYLTLYENDELLDYDYDMLWEELYNINPTEYKNKYFEKNIKNEKSNFLYTIKDGKVKMTITAI